MLKHYAQLLSPLFSISRKEVKKGGGILPGFLILFFLMGWNISRGQLITEPFNYTAHATNGLPTQSSAVWTNNNSGDEVLVSSGSLTYSGLVASTGNKITFDGAGIDPSRTFTSQPSTTAATVYMSFILNISSLGSSTTAGTYFATLGTNSTTFGGCLWIRKSSVDATKYNLGISTRSNSTVNWLATDYTVGTSYFVVDAYQIITGTANDVAKIWVNPSLGLTTEPAANATAAVGTDLTAVSMILLRQDTAVPFVQIDEMRIGLSWASVTPAGAVPNLSIAVNGTPTSFGSVCTNSSTIAVNYTITNTGTVDATNVQIGLTGTHSGDYTVTGFTASSTLAANGGTANYTVTFDPSAAGTRNGLITVTCGNGSSAPTSTLAGSGVAPVTPVLTTNDATNVGGTVATLNGNIGTVGVCPNSTLRGFAYSKTSEDNDPNVGDTNVISSSGASATGNFTLPLTGLPNGTEYSYRAYIYNGTTYTYGDLKSFTTTTPPVNDLCANPTPLTIGATSSGQTLVDSSSNLGSNDVWYIFTPSCSGTHSILVNFTEGEDIDFEVYASCPTSTGQKLTLTNSNAGFDNKSADFAGATVGTTYYLRVIDAGGNSSTFSVLVSTAIAPTIALANTGTPASGNIAAGTNTVALFGFALTPSACNSQFDFNGASIALSGTADGTDLNSFRIIVDANNNGIADQSEIDAPVIGSAINAYENPLEFSFLAQNLTAGVTKRYFLIANVDPEAGNGKTVSASLAALDVDANQTITGSASGNTQTITATSILIADNAQVIPMTASNSIGQIFIAKAKLTVSGESTTVTKMDFVTAALAQGYTQDNIPANGFKLWRTTSPSTFDTNTPIGSVSSTKVTANSTETLSFTTSQNLAVGDYYYWLTLDVMLVGTPPYSIKVNSLTNASVTAPGTTISGSSSAAGTQTIIPPSFILDNNTVVPSGTILIGTNDTVIARAQLSSDSINLTGINFTTSGNASGYTNADIASNGFKLWINSTNDFGTASLFGTAQSSTKTVAADTETISFSGSQNLTGISNHYFWLTVTTSGSATPGKIIAVNGLSYSDISTSTAGVFALGNTTNSGNQTIVSNAPSLTTASASVDAPFSITLSPDNANYRGAITSVKIGATSLAFTTSAGNITLDPAANALLRTPGNKIIDITAANYNAAQVTQTLTVGATAKLALGSPALAAPTTNGGLFATQPSVSYRDKYDNPTTSTATITAAKFDAGTWTLGGTTSVTPGAAIGSVTFTDLTATSAALVNNAQLRFTLNGISGSTPVNSATFTILAPDFISLATFGTTVSENFDTLAATGTSSATPTGWSFVEGGANGNTVYTAGTGNSTTGDTYSFGSTSAADRAFGSLQSGNVIPTIGAKFKNTTGGAINSLTINYVGEQWRLGATGRVDRLDFQYSTNATSLTTGTWTDVDALDFTAPVTTGTVGPLDGNATANKATVSSAITGLNIPNGATFYIRYSSFDATGADDGLAVDNFNIIPCQAPNPGTNGTLTICAGSTPTNAELFAHLGGTPQAGGSWSPPVAGVYTYTVSSSAPCTATASATVTVTTQAAANAGADGVYTICSGTNITLAQLQAAIAGEDAGGTWSPALGGAGTYTYTVAATSPCTAPDTSTVVVTAVSCQAAQLSNCGSTPVLTSVNTRIFAANTVTQATLYRFRVAVSTAPSTYFYAETTYPSFRLTDVVGLTPTYGTTYNVDIQNEFLLSGNTVTSAYGQMCSVTTQAVTNISVPTNQCGQTLAAVNSKIYVNGVTGATMYTYRIAKQSAPNTYLYIETPYSNFRLTNPPTSGNVAIEHNTVYLVAVSVTTSNGSSNFNSECLITTPAGPMTTIQGSQCGDDEAPYVIPTKSTKVYATDYVSGATYTFKLEQYDGATLLATKYATSPINYFDCNMFTGINTLLPSTNYHVYVAINFYGEGEFDHDCVIRTPAALKHEEIITEFKAMAYPNPFANNFMIDVKSASESVVGLKVYDMIGRLIDQKEVRVSDLETTTIGDNYPSGVYNVVVSQENSVQTVRVVKR